LEPNPSNGAEDSVLGMSMILSGFSIPHSLSFLEGFSYTKNNRYLGVIMDVSDVFRPRTQLNDALIASRAGDLGSPPSLSVYFTYRHTIFQRGLARSTPPLLHKERLKINGYANSGALSYWTDNRYENYLASRISL